MKHDPLCDYRILGKIDDCPRCRLVKRTRRGVIEEILAATEHILMHNPDRKRIMAALNEIKST